MRRLGWLEALRLRYNANRVGTVLLGVAVVLSIASFITTAAGLHQFTAPAGVDASWFSLTLAGLVTLGIQGLLLASTYAIAGELARAGYPNARRTIMGLLRQFGGSLLALAGALLMVAVFVVTLLTSVFFSYQTFYSALTSFSQTDAATAEAERETRGNRGEWIVNLANVYVRNEVARSLDVIREGVVQARVARLDGSDSADDDPQAPAAVRAGFDAYRAQLRDIEVFAGRSVDAVAEELRERSAAERRRAVAAARATAEAETREAEAEVREKLADAAAEAAQAEIDRQTKRVSEQQSRVRALEAKQRDQERIMECEEFGRQCQGVPPTSPGRGPNWSAARDAAAAAATDLKAANRELAIEQSRLERARAALAAASRDKAAAKGEADVQREAGRIGPEERAAPPLVSDTQLRQAIQQMRSARLALSSPETFGRAPRQAFAGAENGDGGGETAGSAPAPYDQLLDACETVLTTLGNEAFAEIRLSEDGDASRSIPEIARSKRCRPEQVRRRVDDIRSYNQGLERFFEEGCRSLGPNFSRATSAELIKFGVDCLNYSRLDGEPAAELRALFAELSREHDGDVHLFVQARHGLLTYGDSLAAYSAGVALAIDLLILAASIVDQRLRLNWVDRIGAEPSGETITEMWAATDYRPRERDSTQIRAIRELLGLLEPDAPPPNGVSRPERYTLSVPGSALENVAIGKELSTILGLSAATLKPLAGEGLERQELPLVVKIGPAAPEATTEAGVDAPLDPASWDAPRGPSPWADVELSTANPWTDGVDEGVRFYFLTEYVRDLLDQLRAWDLTFPNAEIAPTAGRRA